MPLTDQARAVAATLQRALQYIANIKVLFAATEIGVPACAKMASILDSQSPGSPDIATLAGIQGRLVVLPEFLGNIEFLRTLQADGGTLTTIATHLDALLPPSWVFNASPALPAGATLTRASTGWTFGSTGVLTSYANDVPRFRYDPAGSGLQGLLNESAAKNELRNSVAAGSIAGTPGTQPTRWSNLGTSPILGGVINQNLGAGTVDGLSYNRWHLSGAPNAVSGLGPTFEANNFVIAAPGETWTASGYLRLEAGSWAGISACRIQITERNAAGGSTLSSIVVVPFPTNAALKTQRFSVSRTLTDPATAFVTSAVTFQGANGVPVDFTFDIGQPDLVKAAALASPVITTGAAAVTRAADVLTLTTPPGIYDVVIGRVSGTTVLPAQVVGASFVVPTDPSPLQSVNLAWPGV